MPDTRPHLAARAARWSARHRRAAILGWLAFVVLAVLAGGAAGGLREPADGQDGVGESGRAERLRTGAFRGTDMV
ncbi:MAG TPA: hypothetical protein VF533_01000, partial [Solirubrobacteraceae bacterium]